LVDGYFGLRFTERDIDASITRALSRGRLIRGRTGEIIATERSRADIGERIERTNELEARVREEWLESLAKQGKGRDARIDEELWNCLRSYMAKAFQRHGAETTMLLKPPDEASKAVDRTLMSYQKEAFKECCAHTPEDLATNAIRKFFVESTPSRARYVAQLLDGTFSFYAVCVDEATSNYLKSAIKPVAIFLDTNFMFGLLKLHDNPLNQVSEELVEAIQQHQFPFKLYYHERTLEEFQAALKRIRDRLVGYHWTQSLSRAAINTRNLSTIEQRYHEANATRSVDARVLLTKYEHIEQILLEKGFFYLPRAGRSASARRSYRE
jgi:hypothetical protein